MKPQLATFSHHYFHDIVVAREPETVFDYVTNPNRWHEWFLASQPASIDLDPQQPDETFELMTKYRLLPFLPFRLMQDLHCRVSKSDRPYLWEVEAESPMIRAIVSYTLSRGEGGTIIKRKFCYSSKGRYRLMEPLLLRRRVANQLNLSLQRLKQQLELNSHD